MPPEGAWITTGFEGFRQGTFDNAGQNLYVSRAGVLQRIHNNDLNANGRPDLLICNSQDHWESPPVSVYADALGSARLQELPSHGSLSGALADLNGDGYQDLALAMYYDGSRQDLNAVVYYGSPEGLSERLHQRLPAPTATSVAAGDFNGDGKPDLAFITRGKVRVFYQTELCFEPKRFTDLDIEAAQLGAGDLDGDGCAELCVFGRDGKPRVYWGGPEGLHAGRVSEVSVEEALTHIESAPQEGGEAEHVEQVRPLPAVVTLGGRPHLFVPTEAFACLVPVAQDRSFGEPLVFPSRRALAVAAGDVNGDGHPDLVFACRDRHDGQECSWVYWGGPEGFDGGRRTPLPTARASDVAVGDLNGNGCADIAFSRERSDESFTTESLVYRGCAEGVEPEPLRFITHDARRVFIARFADEPLPQLVFVNHRARGATGDVDPVIYLNEDGAFAPERHVRLSGRDAVDAVCCDLTDNGYPDIITANCSENAVHLDPGSFIFSGGPEGYTREPAVTLPTQRAHGVVCADLNHSGYLDLVFVGFKNPELLVFYGGPEGYDADNPVRIIMEADGEKYDQPRWLYLADLNNNGWLDLFVPQIAADRSFILWGGPEGFSMERRRMLSVFHASCAQAADLTGNGYLDLIIGGHAPSLQGPHDSFVYVYWNGPEGIREDRRMVLPANGVNAMTVADFNGDGHLDLFVCNYHDGRVRDIDSYIYWGGEGGRFSERNRTRLFMHSASGCVAADFDGDGRIDLAVAYHKVNNDHVGYSAVWWNGPEGFSEDRVTRLPSQGPHGMVRTGFGNQRDRGPEEHYVSAPFELPRGARVRDITWDADVPAGTWVRADVRFARSRARLAEAQWQEVTDTSAASSLRHSGRWVQYRLALGAPWGAGTPRVREVRVRYE